MNKSDRLRGLYPDIQPSESGRMAADGGHEIYYECCGRADGLPVVVLHGGPGGGCSAAMRRFFNPDRWRVILFDQRGCGRSRPLSRLEENTTWRLVEDMERLRTRLSIERWVLFGGSWGSTLAIAYALKHRAQVAGMVLRGVFLLTPGELDWFYGGEAGALLPEAWERFLEPLRPEERDAPIAAYHRLLTGPDRRARARAAAAWTAWESAAIEPEDGRGARRRRGGDPQAADALSRIECHYFHHGGFLEHPTQILDAAATLSDMPGFVVQGRFDLVTPPRSAVSLTERWPGARLEIVESAGHSASEPGMIDALVRATDAMADRLS